ncbi:MAG: class I SAM-dependent methyltransferase [Marinisporobacter sp.]|jgi:O-methyltransferase involved in polyketide biosynthesis|nr:class I SAM-dependent methyltransferase [Marinisporobacter sp.]
MHSSNQQPPFELGGIQQTMFLPLWGRFMESQKSDPLLYDAKAIEIINQLDYDFSTLGEKLGEYNAISWVVRAKTMDMVVENFIQKHPNGTIVNIGAGLDTTFERIDNGKIMWYDLDLPDSIAFRKKFISETNRRKYISKSVFDYSWFNDITPIQDNVLFLAAGVLMFFEVEELRQLFCQLSSEFPNGEFFFDTLSREGLKYANDMMRNAGMKEHLLSWGVDSANEIAKWDNKIKVIDEFPYYKHTPRKTSWNPTIISTMDLCDENKGANFYHIKFI